MDEDDAARTQLEQDLAALQTAASRARTIARPSQRAASAIPPLKSVPGTIHNHPIENSRDNSAECPFPACGHGQTRWVCTPAQGGLSQARRSCRKHVRTYHGVINWPDWLNGNVDQLRVRLVRAQGETKWTRENFSKMKSQLNNRKNLKARHEVAKADARAAYVTFRLAQLKPRFYERVFDLDRLAQTQEALNGDGELTNDAKVFLAIGDFWNALKDRLDGQPPADDDDALVSMQELNSIIHDYLSVALLVEKKHAKVIDAVRKVWDHMHCRGYHVPTEYEYDVNPFLLLDNPPNDSDAVPPLLDGIAGQFQAMWNMMQECENVRKPPSEAETAKFSLGEEHAVSVASEDWMFDWACDEFEEDVDTSRKGKGKRKRQRSKPDDESEPRDDVDELLGDGTIGDEVPPADGTDASESEGPKVPSKRNLRAQQTVEDSDSQSEDDARRESKKLKAGPSGTRSDTRSRSRSRSAQPTKSASNSRPGNRSVAYSLSAKLPVSTKQKLSSLPQPRPGRSGRNPDLNQELPDVVEEIEEDDQEGPPEAMDVGLLNRLILEQEARVAIVSATAANNQEVDMDLDESADDEPTNDGLLHHRSSDSPESLWNLVAEANESAEGLQSLPVEAYQKVCQATFQYIYDDPETLGCSSYIRKVKAAVKKAGNIRGLLQWATDYAIKLNHFLDACDKDGKVNGQYLTIPALPTLHSMGLHVVTVIPDSEDDSGSKPLESDAQSNQSGSKLAPAPSAPKEGSAPDEAVVITSEAGNAKKTPVAIPAPPTTPREPTPAPPPAQEKLPVPSASPSATVPAPAPAPAPAETNQHGPVPAEADSGPKLGQPGYVFPLVTPSPPRQPTPPPPQGNQDPPPRQPTPPPPQEKQKSPRQPTPPPPPQEKQKSPRQPTPPPPPQEKQKSPRQPTPPSPQGNQDPPPRQPAPGEETFHAPDHNVDTPGLGSQAPGTELSQTQGKEDQLPGETSPPPRQPTPPPPHAGNKQTAAGLSATHPDDPETHSGSHQSQSGSGDIGQTQTQGKPTQTQPNEQVHRYPRRTSKSPAPPANTVKPLASKGKAAKVSKTAEAPPSPAQGPLRINQTKPVTSGVRRSVRGIGQAEKDIAQKAGLNPDGSPWTPGGQGFFDGGEGERF